MAKRFKFLSVLLAILMIASIIPITPFAAALEEEEWTIDGYSNNYYYSLKNGTATIVGLVDETIGGNITIPTTLNGYKVTGLAAGSFWHCTEIKTITIPSTITYMGEGVFWRCLKLTSIAVDENNKNYCSVDGVLFNKTKTEILAYPCAASKTSYSIPSTVKSITYGAFAFCKNLKSITFPAGLTSIGECAFFECSGLSTTPSIPAGVKSIGPRAFWYCTNIYNITIPDSVASIGLYTFAGCDNLISVYYTGSQEKWNQIIFDKEDNTLSGVNIYFNVCPKYGVNKHTYTSKIIQPTHTATGQEIFTCACGHTYSETIEKLTEHSYDTSYISKSPTHTETGIRTYFCACGDSYTETIPKTTKHTYKWIITIPTCTEDGYKIYTCECGDSYTEKSSDATGHSHTSVVTTPATHLTEGVMTYTCACGNTYTEAIAKTPEHTYDTDYVSKSPTHTETGIRTYFCACGDTYTETIAKTTEHKHNAVVTAPTCTEPGYTTYSCECGDSYVDDFTEVIDHTDNSGDKFCDYCDEFLGSDEEETECSHICHKSGIMGFFWKIINFFQMLFGVNPVCECGVAHY